MPGLAAIDEFLSHRQLALLRLSPSTPIVGTPMDRELAKKGYEVHVAYLDPADSGRSLASIKDAVEGVIIAVPRKECERAVREALAADMPRLWLQSGCDTPEAVQLAQQQGVPTIHGACVLMYAEPVESIHAFHRWLWQLFGRLAK